MKQKIDTEKSKIYCIISSIKNRRNELLKHNKIKFVIAKEKSQHISGIEPFKNQSRLFFFFPLKKTHLNLPDEISNLQENERILNHKEK